MADAEIGVVVDVAVERRDNVRLTARRLELLAVDRMGVRLGDDADTGPAGVGEHRRARSRGRHRRAEQVVGEDLLADRPSVVAELTDLGSCLVDEGQHISRDANGAGLIERVDRSRSNRLSERWQVEIMPTHHHVHTGRVATAHLEPVDGAERLLDRHIRLDGGCRRAGPGELEHRADQAAAVVPEGPTEIPDPHEPGCSPFDLVVAEGGRHHLGVDLGPIDEHLQPVEPFQ